MRRKGGTPTEVASKQDTYKTKIKTPLIQVKINRAVVQWMVEVNQNDSNAAKRFWVHINAQGRKTEGFQCSLTTQEGINVEGDEARGYIRRTIEETFAELKPNEIEQNTGRNTAKTRTLTRQLRRPRGNGTD